MFDFILFKTFASLISRIGHWISTVILMVIILSCVEFIFSTVPAFRSSLNPFYRMRYRSINLNIFQFNTCPGISQPRARFQPVQTWQIYVQTGKCASRSKMLHFLWSKKSVSRFLQWTICCVCWRAGQFLEGKYQITLDPFRNDFELFHSSLVLQIFYGHKISREGDSRKRYNLRC